MEAEGIGSRKWSRDSLTATVATVRVRIRELGELGLLVKPLIGQAFEVAYSEILTAERMRAGRGLRLHTRRTDPVRLAVRGTALLEAERKLRWMGVRVVDCWGCLLTPTLSDFVEALDLEPMRVRQSSDNA